MRIYIEKKPVEVPEGTLLSKLAEQQADGGKILLAKVDGKIRELHHAVHAGDDVQFLTVLDKSGYEAMRRTLNARHGRIIASGNGMRRNPALQRIMAEKFRMEVQLSPNTEEAACGAAMAGLAAVGGMSWEKAVGFERSEGNEKRR